MNLAMLEKSLNPPAANPESLLSFGRFLRLLVKALIHHGVSPCVLRNYEGFPEDNAGNDVDFMIHPAELPLAIRAIQSIETVRIVGFNEQFHVAMFFIQGVSQIPGARAIQVDFIRSFTWKGMPFLTTETVLRAAVPRQVDDFTFLVPSPIHEAIISLMTSLIVSGFVKEKYFPRVRQIFAAKRDGVIAVLEPAFGNTQAMRLTDSTIAGDQEKMIDCVSPLRRALAMRNLTSRPMRSILAIVRHHMIVLGVRHSPRTLQTVSIIGPDHAVTSSLVEALVPLLHYSAAQVSGCSQPFPREPDARGSGADSLAKNPLVSMATVSARLVERWLSQFKGRTNLTLRICSGGYCDLLIDPLEWGYTGPDWFARLVCALSPAPDLWILVDSTPESSRLKANATQVEAAESPLDRYRAFAKSKRNWMSVDRSPASKEVVERAYAAIIEFLSVRMSRQLKSFA